MNIAIAIFLLWAYATIGFFNYVTTINNLEENIDDTIFETFKYVFIQNTHQTSVFILMLVFFSGFILVPTVTIMDNGLKGLYTYFYLIICPITKEDNLFIMFNSEDEEIQYLAKEILKNKNLII